MAKGKKTFIFYSDWINMVREMSDSDSGELLKHILKYVNDENPTTENPFVKIVFGHMKPMLKEDLDKWDLIRQKRKEAGAKGGKQKVANARQMLQGAKQVVAVNDNVNVSTYVDEDKIDKIFLQFREKYKTYNAQLLSDGIFINSIAREFFNTHDKNIQKETLRKYLNEYLNRLDQDKKVHNNKKQFMEHFPNWLRKQEIKLVIPKQEKQRYV